METRWKVSPGPAGCVTFARGDRRQGVEVVPMELIIVPFGIAVGAFLVVGAVTGVAFKFVWIVLKIIFVVCFWWLFLLIGGVALLRSILH